MRKKSVATTMAALALAASVFAGGAGAAFAKEIPASTDAKGKAADNAPAAVEAPKTEAPKVEVSDLRGHQTESSEANDQRGRGGENEAATDQRHQDDGLKHL